ncbi:uncharacterized protein LOC131956624 [Physella acuta]|uniref:uncharacterized protein LOC131956624 n=1 Tax=Physella acuta TaxID=109671 RepID=UPI0027DDC752|nr:uncharacterized protein LOC131956624 [Physella acuta]
MALGQKGTDEHMASRHTSTHPPQWMKQLEVKYQRLHAKIASQASRISNKRHHNIVQRKGPATRLKLARTIGKEESDTGIGKKESDTGIGKNESDIGTAMGMEELNTDIVPSYAPVKEYPSQPFEDSRHGTNEARIVKPDHEMNPASPNPAHRMWRSEGVDESRDGTAAKVENKIETCVAKPEHSVEKLIAVGKDPKTILLTELAGSCDQDFGEVCSSLQCPDLVLPCCAENDQLDHASVISSVFHSKLNLEFYEAEELKSDASFVLDKNGNSTTAGEFQKNCLTLALDTEGGDMEVGRTRQRHRDNKSRKIHGKSSQVTTHSCPASFREFGYSDNGDVSVFKRVNNNFGSAEFYSSADGWGNVGRTRVFARMSKEARHAVDETLREMEMEEELQNRLGDGSSGRSPRVNNNNNNSSTILKIQDGEDNSMSAESEVSIPSRNIGVKLAKNDNNQPPQRVKNTHLSSTYPGTNRSNSPKPNANGRTSRNRKLPQIERVGSQSGNHFPNPHSRLPDIGRPLTFRENTFEITPVDFDIRFHQIITCQTGRGETPPPDVQQQAIEKCQQWLVRHTPRQLP